MQERAQKEILNGFLLVLRPIVRMLIRFGIGYREFSEVVKTAFVDVASTDFGIRGRPTNISRVAVMTGLTRKEVRRVRDELQDGKHVVTVRNTPLWRILHNWYTKADFLDDKGLPAVLPFEGAEPSFSHLVRVTGGDIPPGAIRTELKRVGAVEETESGSLRVLKRTFLPSDSHENLVESLVQCVYPLMSTICHNTNPELSEDSWPNKTAFSNLVRPSEVNRLRRISRDQIVNFASTIDDILSSYEVLREMDGNADSNDNASIYVGAFYFEDKSGRSDLLQQFPSIDFRVADD